MFGSQVKFEYLPYSERDQFNLEMWLPEGTPVAQTEKAVDRVTAAIKGDKRISQVVSFIGTGSPRFYSSYAPEAPAENYAQVFINTVSGEATVELAKEYTHSLQQVVPEGSVRVRRLSWKETKAPLEVRVVSDNAADLRAVGQQVAQIFAATPNTHFVRDDWRNPTLGVAVRVKQDEADRVGVSKEAVAQTLGGSLKGYPVSTLWEGDKPLDIVLRLDEQDRQNLSDVSQVYVTTAYNTKVPLRQVADVVPAWHLSNIVRRNGLRTLTVSSDTDFGRVAAQILGDVRPAARRAEAAGRDAPGVRRRRRVGPRCRARHQHGAGPELPADFPDAAAAIPAHGPGPDCALHVLFEFAGGHVWPLDNGQPAGHDGLPGHQQPAGHRGAQRHHPGGLRRRAGAPNTATA